ncbi:DUF2795 domain-containing protein [Kineococcus glutinatus]|uniref:DUF2795 domain-containing protein n=1 Tax=Kineococcus glutinatus TaxID=1070872 RepID=A0ABP9H4U8_9ACTN
MATTDEVLHAIKKATFPADKDALIASALESGAGDDVVRALRSIPPVDYADKDEVARSVPTAEPVDAHTAAQQARGQADSRIAADLREVAPDPLEEAQRQS